MLNKNKKRRSFCGMVCCRSWKKSNKNYRTAEKRTWKKEQWK